MIPSLNRNFGLDRSDSVPGVPGNYGSDQDDDGGAYEGQDGTYAPSAMRGEDRDASDEISLDEATLLSMVREAEAQATSYLTSQVRTSWNRAYKAYRNEHFDGSKYLSDQWRGRSKLFRPKTRTGVRKDVANAIEALFSTADVVSIKPQDEQNPEQLLSAQIKNEIINYRLDRTSGKAGLPWFTVAAGARQDSVITGLCVSKQYWLYRERRDGKVVFDRPDVKLIPPENVLIDPAADWTNPAQTAKYLIVRYPMHVSEVMDMVKRSTHTTTPWMPIDPEELHRVASVSPVDAQNIRRAREGGLDTKDAAATGVHFRLVWVYEVFLEHDGEQWTFWTAGTGRMLSKPVLTETVYPHLGGERPIVIGYGSLDSHRVFPMSPVESWQQLQQEANDIANLRLDQMKQVVTPITKVKRGRNVDIAEVQRRGTNGVVMLQALDDVEWDRPPDVPNSAFLSENIINADFDALAGDFNTSTVQTDRKLNETVGGMRLMAGSAGSLTGYDLRVWAETWVEPVLWQIVKLEEYYENDETVLAIAGQNAQLERFGINVITDRMLMHESTLRVDIGTGGSSHDPMMALQKFQMAAQAAGNILMPFIEQGAVHIQPDAEAIITEVFGKAGYRDGGKRFFKIIPPEEVPPPPPDPKVQLLQAKAEAEQQKSQLRMAEGQQNLQIKQQLGNLQIQEAWGAVAASQAKSQIGLRAQAAKAQIDHASAAHGAVTDAAVSEMQARLDREAHQLETEKMQLEREKLEIEKERANLARQQLAWERKASQTKAEAVVTSAKAQAQAARIKAQSAAQKPAAPKGK